MAKVLTLGTSGIEELDLDPTIYYQEISVENEESTTLTDYQVKFTINTSALITASKLNTDATNMRVLDSADNEVYFGYINETWNTTTTEFWLKIPTISGSETKVYKFAYGNSNWTNKTADLDDVMQFVDQFEGSSLDTSKWQNISGTPSYATVSDGKLTMAGGVVNIYNTDFNLAPTDDWIICHKLRYLSYSGSYLGRFGARDGTLNSYCTWHQANGNFRLANYYGNGSNSYSTIMGMSTTQYVFDIVIDNTNARVRGRVAGGSWTSLSTNFRTNSYMAPFIQNIEMTLSQEIEYIYTRKYTENEPTVTIGSETEYDSAVDTISFETIAVLGTL